MAGCRLSVRLTPRGVADRIEGVGPAGELLVRVRAAPVAGAADRSLVLVLAQTLGLGRSAVVLERAGAARRKVLRLEGIEPSFVAGLWPGVRCEDLTQRR